MISPIALVVHGHFYQPPRENPWSDAWEREPSASPFHDWNERIHAECYRANAFARIHDRVGHIERIVNNYARMSFNFGPTLARWIERHDRQTHARLMAADADQIARLGAGGGIAQAYAHPILPLATHADRRTQVLWGLADFRRRFGRDADGLWLPETAANADSLETLIEAGVAYTILAPEQIAAVRAPKAEWTLVDRDSVDTGRAYRWYHRDGSGRFLTVAVFDGPLSRSVAFSDATRDSAAFVAAVKASAARSHVTHTPLVLCASDGELFGHHKKFADLNLAFTTFVEGPSHNIAPTNLGAYLRAHPADWEMRLDEGSDGRGTAWSCSHGVGRWLRDCGCSMGGAEHGWNQRWRTPLREAMDFLQRYAADVFEDQGACLLVDPWGARDAYGHVVDDSLAGRNELVAHFATPHQKALGQKGRDRALLMLEAQRATLLMYASCGWYFDDIAGLEAGLVMRFAAHAADLLTEAGATVPLNDLLDLLAGARTNESSGDSGADLFRKMARDRITPERALAEVAFGLLAPVSGASPSSSPLKPAGHWVSATIRSETQGEPRATAGRSVRGTADVTNKRTGEMQTLPFKAEWDPRLGFSCVINGESIELSALGPESRHALLSHLMPWLEAEGEAQIACRTALDLGRGVVGAGEGVEDIANRRGFARLMMRLLSEVRPLGASTIDIAQELFVAAGASLSSGTTERASAQELVAQLIETNHDPRLSRLATQLGFVTPGSDAVSKRVPG